MSNGTSTSNLDVTNSARERFGNEIIKPYVDWYWRDLNRLHRAYIRCYWLGLVCGFLATILAAFPKNISNDLVPENTMEAFSSIAGWLVVFFSALSTLTTGTLTPRFKRMLDDRDKGRIRLDLVAAKFKIKDYPEDIRPQLLEIVSEIAAVEGLYGPERDKGEGDKAPGSP